MKRIQKITIFSTAAFFTVCPLLLACNAQSKVTFDLTNPIEKSILKDTTDKSFNLGSIVKAFPLDTTFQTLKREFGKNKELPKGYEKQVLIALSHFPELKDTRIRWVFKQTYTPLFTKPDLKTLINKKGKRAYVITISTNTIDTLKHLLYSNLEFDEQVGIMGHELSHVVDFQRKNMLGSFGNLVGQMSPRFLDKMEYNTDMICIQHGLGKELEAYSQHVRNSMHVQNWRGVDYIYVGKDPPERYMNPSTIEKFTRHSSIN